MRGKERVTAFPLPLAFLMRFRDHCITDAGMNSYGDQLHKQLSLVQKKVERMRNDFRNALIAVKKKSSFVPAFKLFPKLFPTEKYC